jgi:hypothetical protein
MLSQLVILSSVIVRKLREPRKQLRGKIKEAFNDVAGMIGADPTTAKTKQEDGQSTEMY